MSEENKRIVEELNQAFAEGDSKTFLSHSSEDISWTMVGEKTTRGKAEIREWMASMKDMETPKFTFNKLLADGNSVVCTGNMLMKNKEGVEEKYSFCDIYEFNNNEIADLQSFVVKTHPAGEKQKAATP